MMDNETRQHLRRMVQHASLVGRATAFDRLLVDLQALLDDGDLPAVEAAPADAVELVEAAPVEAAPVVEEATVEAAPKPKPKRKTTRRRRARGRAVEQPAAPVEAEAPKKAAAADVQEVDAPAAVESALGSVEPDASGTLADLFPAAEEAGA